MGLLGPVPIAGPVAAGLVGVAGAAVVALPGLAEAAAAVYGDLFGVGEAAVADNALSITFNTAHYASRLGAAGLDIGEVEATVGETVSGFVPNWYVGTSAYGQQTIDGVLIQFRARLLTPTSVNVGTIFPVQ